MKLLQTAFLAFTVTALLAAPAISQTAAEPPPAPPLIAPAGQPAPDAGPTEPEAFPAEQPEPGGPAAVTTEAEDRGLTGEQVQENQPAPPTDQGTLQPEIVEGEGSDQAPELYALLQRVRQAPPGLNGRPIPRPNPLASEPTTEMTPAQPENPSLFPDGYVE